MEFRRPETLEATEIEVDWTIECGANEICERIVLMFDEAVTESENVTVKIQPAGVEANEYLVAAVNVSGTSTVVIENITGLLFGDNIRVQFANTDLVEVTGTCTMYLGG